MKTKFILQLIAFYFGAFGAMADSPLTSTQFSDAYQKEPIIIAASKTNGLLTDELMGYLLNAKNPIDVKMALINKLGWEIEGKGNAETFLNYVMNKKKYKREEELIKKGSAEVLICLAYLKAMDNYFDVTNAVQYADFALKKNSKSLTINLIASLINAQKIMDTDWCEIYRLLHNVKKNSSFKKDMKDAAIRIIFQYIDGYKEYCK